MSGERRDEFLRGLRDTAPLMVSAIPFGLIFGALAGKAGLAPAETMAMSLLVFSGAAQFVAVALIGAGAGVWMIWLTTLILNLRHLLYAAALVDHVRHLHQGWRFILAAMLTDETFALMERRYREAGGAARERQGREAHVYYLASCLGMYANWALWTFAGILAGARFARLQDWGLEFAMFVTFIGIIVPACRSRARALAALAAATIAVLARHLPHNGGLLLAVCGGIAAGLLARRMQRAPA